MRFPVHVACRGRRSFVLVPLPVLSLTLPWRVVMPANTFHFWNLSQGNYVTTPRLDNVTIRNFWIGGYVQYYAASNATHKYGIFAMNQ